MSGFEVQNATKSDCGAESSRNTDFPNPEQDMFYFETDHLAFRSSNDYSEVLKTTLTIEALKNLEIKNFNKAVELRNEALADPLKVLDKIVQGEDLGMPELTKIPELPVIDFTKYGVKIPEKALNSIYLEKNDIATKKLDPQKEFYQKERKSKAWTPEEQKRLEELLKLYPPEPVEMRRYRKIADALGNRTTQQVMSRVQKFFNKLVKHNLPVPGRLPKCARKIKKNALHKHQRHNYLLWKPTTFFPEFNVPVLMNDSESVPGPSTRTRIGDLQQPSGSSSYLMTTGYTEEPEGTLLDEPQKSDRELQLDLLKRIRQAKLVESARSFQPYRHFTFRCDYCAEDPIVGTRWHCGTCREVSVDFCTDCAVAQLYSDNCHPLSHQLVTFTTDKPSSNTYGTSDSESNVGSGKDNVNSSGLADSTDMSESDDEGICKLSELTAKINGSNHQGFLDIDIKVEPNDLSNFSIENDDSNYELFSNSVNMHSDLFEEISTTSLDGYLKSSPLFEND